MTPEPENTKMDKEQHREPSQPVKEFQFGWKQSDIAGTPEWKVKVQAEACRKFLKHLREGE